MLDLSKAMLRGAALAVAITSLGGCSLFGMNFGMAQLSEKECLMRAMYFESNRSSSEGMLAVGTVVMNRLHDGRYPRSVCG
ncbi:MAG: cell wall hydrolase, partial [Devosia sp.]